MPNREVLAPDVVRYPEAVDADVCRQVIELFEAEPGVRPGVTDRVDGTSDELDTELKRSMDYLISPDSGPDWLAVDEVMMKALFGCFADYHRDNPFLREVVHTFCGWQIQRSKVGDYFDWHMDDDGARRRVAVIIYLNEGFEGGETEFRFQDLKVEAKAGSLLMFPPYWTHVHRGVPVREGTKYIATTFLLSPAR